MNMQHCKNTGFYSACLCDGVIKVEICLFPHMILGEGAICVILYDQKYLEKTPLVINSQHPLSVNMMCTLAEFHTWK